RSTRSAIRTNLHGFLRIRIRGVSATVVPSSSRTHRRISPEGDAEGFLNQLPGDCSACCSIVELRQYTLRPGKRELLIELFDRDLIEPQETAGMCVIGQFRDLDRPDVFTWLRGFESMPQRRAALSAFYEGPVWARHQDAANSTMIDSDNVRLLRPVT